MMVKMGSILRCIRCEIIMGYLSLISLQIAGIQIPFEFRNNL